MNNTIEIVSRFINSWDPVGLLESGAPLNEYDIEINEINKQMIPTTKAIELAKIIQNTFKNKMGIRLGELSCLRYSFLIIEELHRSNLESHS